MKKFSIKGAIVLVIIIFSFMGISRSDPTYAPTNGPTDSPTNTPTAEPTDTPSVVPSALPTWEPTFTPTGPSNAPTEYPTIIPTTTPTGIPTMIPTDSPSNEPTAEPSAEPTHSPTDLPTTEPTNDPSAFPSATPTIRPTVKPTIKPSVKPTAKPTIIPTVAPSVKPTVYPTCNPTPRTSWVASAGDPRLLSFTLDCGVGKLVLSFDSIISAKSVDMRGFSLQAADDITNVGAGFSIYEFTSSFNDLSLQGNTTQLTVYMSSDDIARLNLAEPIGRSLSSTFLTMQYESVLTPIGRPVAAINASRAIAPTSLVQDIFPPYLLSFSLFMETGLITITFSEPIDVSTFTLTGLTIQCCAYLGDGTNDPAVEDLTRNLLDQGDAHLVSTSNYNRTIVYHLGAFNLNHIKAKVGLAASLDTTYLSAYASFVKDTSGKQFCFPF